MEKLEYTTIEKSFQYEIPKIKGSRFFATLIPVQTREEIDDTQCAIRTDKEGHTESHINKL